MDIKSNIGVDESGNNTVLTTDDIDRVKLQLIISGYNVENLSEYLSNVTSHIAKQLNVIRSNLPCAQAEADKRIERFLRNFLIGVAGGDNNKNFLPEHDFICDHYGTARLLSLPETGDEFHSEYIDSYRTYNGILHNSSTDKRTTKDVFHIVASDLPVPLDKKEVPKITFAKMLQVAFSPDDDILLLPFSACQRQPIKVFTSSYLRPVICPRIPGIQEEKRMDIRFFVPGSLVSILDCVESIFGNGGSPMLIENDAAMNPITWSGQTGCIVFAPQLRKCTKKFLGLPHVSDATDRQKRDGMCWERSDELYHAGKPFKVVARDGSGVIVTIVADTYSGYGKKEIKTHMSYAANLMGMCEEEHSGGTLVFPQYDLGDEFNYSDIFDHTHTFDNVVSCLPGAISPHPEGYAIDKSFSNIVYVPAYANFCLPKLTISWSAGGSAVALPLELGKHYILPSGYRITLATPDGKDGRWKMIGTWPNGIFCYKPATVSGGGKSEIAKPIDEFISSGPTIVYDYEKDFEVVKTIINGDFSRRFINSDRVDDRSILSPARSLGSVIKLLTPNELYSEEYNGWLATIPPHILELIFVIKRFSKQLPEGDWQQLFTVDKINGQYGNELRYRHEKLFEHYLRIGFDYSNHRRLFSLRDDFVPSIKFQLADDITATTLVPTNKLPFPIDNDAHPSIKLVHNCEYRLYQRPDEAIIPGYDPETEYDMTRQNVFTCNFKPMTRDAVNRMIRERIIFERYSEPMKKMLLKFVNDPHAPAYVVCPSELRTMPNGEISKNQRYLQNRHDVCDPLNTYLTTTSLKLWKRITDPFSLADVPVVSILSGRRNNPPADGIKPLCVYNPLHYLDLPELFLEYITSVTGKSPSTTGAGLEGPMTKGPFNCLSSVYDLNNALLSFILSGYHGFLSSAGYVGPNFRVEHDITYLIPEIWSRMKDHERQPEFLIANGFFEKCGNFEYRGRVIPFERMGYRITRKFIREFAGRVFSAPDAIFSDRMLRPEQQDVDIFVDSMDTLCSSHRQAADLIIRGGGIDDAIPPLRVLLHIARDGTYNGMTLNDDEFRNLFRREIVINSQWYRVRLQNYQRAQVQHLSDGLFRIRAFRQNNQTRVIDDNIVNLEHDIEKELAFVQSDNYFSQITGTLGKCCPCPISCSGTGT